MAENALDKIIAEKKRHIETCKARVTLADLEAEAKLASPVRDFYAVLSRKNQAGETGLICEIKRASPSAGLIRSDFDPLAIARTYERAGASCLSILTDAPFFQGSDDILIAARAVVQLPVLRKDFMLDPYQIVEARAIGADCILIIMACVDDALAKELAQTAASHGMSILVEVHDEAELQRFLGLGLKTPKTMLGVNNRNLKTLAIDLATTERLAATAGKDWLLVGESGIRTKADITRLKSAGVNCFLIGENLLKSDDTYAATKAML
jgi:indole-3-glycerol phosphate synthase